MPRKIVKAVIDTNVWISFLISKNYSRLEKILLSNYVTLLSSLQLLNEFQRVVKRPKFLRYFSSDDIQFILTVLQEKTDIVDVKTVETTCRDDKDNFLLALAIDGKADFLITGDADLLILGNHHGTKIITIADFLNQHLQ